MDIGGNGEELSRLLVTMATSNCANTEEKSTEEKQAASASKTNNAKISILHEIKAIHFFLITHDKIKSKSAIKYH